VFDASVIMVKNKRCPLPDPGEISDDDAPTVRGPTTRSKFLPWLAARGVAKSTAVAFRQSLYGRAGNAARAQAEDGDTDEECFELDVGDRPEPALLCEEDAAPSAPWATDVFEDVLHPREGHAVVIVVRNKQPFIVLDVGMSMTAYDDGPSRWLDLALETEDNGRLVELRDRAPDGTKLVTPPSVCVAHEAFLDQCEKDFAGEPNPESFAHRGPNGEERFEFRDCPIERGDDNKLRVRRSDEGSNYEPAATIHDCAGGRDELVRQVHDARPGRDQTLWRRALAFFDKSCSQRGKYVWKGDRFLKQPTAR
jgi:hypothetical protein